MSDEAIAARWFGVRAEFELLGRGRMAVRSARQLLLYVVSAGLLMGDFDPKRFCDVVVFRRDTGATVATFSYTHLGEATGHVTDLRDRLLSAHVFDLCRELGLSTDLVVGPGQGIELDPVDPWVGVRTNAGRSGSS
jgi:hypothetical protein